MALGPVVAVVGGSEIGEDVARVARALGRALAERGAVIVNGGLGGVMEAVSQGAVDAGGTVIGILPGTETSEGNPHLTVAIATGLGRSRNTIIAITCDVMVAIDGSYGTLSEVAQALNHGRPVVSLGSWDVAAAGPVDKRLFHRASTAEAAAALAMTLAKPRSR